MTPANPTDPRNDEATVDKVLITGLGAVSALGVSVADLWRGLCDATAGPTPYADEFGIIRAAYQVPDRGAFASGAGRATAYASSAADAALSDAGLAGSDLAAAGVLVGTTLGDIDVPERAYALGTGPGPSPYGVTAALANRLGVCGPTRSISTGCSAGLYAVGLAAEMIRSGAADVVLAGGTETLSRVAYGSLDRLTLLDPLVCRPFDAARQGMVPGEGAAMLVLESASHAARRTARQPYAEVGGFAWSCDGYHATAPEPSGSHLRRAMEHALRAAGATPDMIGAVVPHRAGVPDNDTIETDAAAAALGRGGTAVHGSKAVLGHTAGAAGAFACLIGSLILEHRLVPPNAHIADLDPNCPLDVVRDGPAPLRGSHVLVSGTGFGGNNGALVLGGAPC